MNGWQRIWLVLSGFWVAFVGLLVIGEPTERTKHFGAFVFLCSVPILIYGAGLAVAWIRRGFKE